MLSNGPRRVAYSKTVPNGSGGRETRGRETPILLDVRWTQKSVLATFADLEATRPVASRSPILVVLLPAK